MVAAETGAIVLFCAAPAGSYVDVVGSAFGVNIIGNHLGHRMQASP